MPNSSDIQKYLLAQFENAEAQSELKSINSKGFDWIKRTRNTIVRASSLLPKIGSAIKINLELEFNAGSLLKAEYAKGEPLVKSIEHKSSGLRNWYDATSKVVATVRESHGVDSQQVSAGVQAILLGEKHFGSTFVINGGSTYPDLLWADTAYEGLPVQSRANLVDGPCLRGKKPSNVPDGLEIKTNRGKRIKVDAHGAHQGLHLGVTWDIVDNLFCVTGVWIAYVRVADHRESGRNVKVTTVKYSFGHSLFMSIL